MRNIGRNAMRSVKMHRLQLLGIVIENKKKHVKEFLEAVDDYKSAVKKIAETNLKIASGGDLAEMAQAKHWPSAPVSYANEYDRAIRMLELSVEDTIELEEDIFNQLVLDEWNWKHSFVASATMYKSF